MFTFWYRWLLTVFVGFTLFGVAYAFFGMSGLFAIMLDPIDLALWGGPMPAETEPFARFTFGIIGALLAAFGELGWFVTRYAVSRREPWAWNALAVSAIVWFVIDGIVSVWSGAAINVAFNLGFAVLLAIPLIGIRPHLTGQTASTRPATA